jgi:hypothetical protein
LIRTVRCRAPIAAAALAGFFAILISACGVPLAPGYQIQKEALTVHFVPGDPPHLAVRAEYRLANVGNAPLHFIGVELPGDKSFGRANVRAEIDGKEITLQHNPHEAADDWRIPFPVPWRQKEKLNLVLSYDLAAQPASDPRIFVAASTFYLNDSGWFPGLMGFKAFLSPAVVRPNPTLLTVIIPADFRITASGEPRGAKKQNRETEYRFRIRKADFDPYILAGQYSEQAVIFGDTRVTFWNAKPLSPPDAQVAGARVFSAYQIYAKAFGALSHASIFIIANRDYNDPQNKLWQVLLFPPPRIVFSPGDVFVKPVVDEPFPSFSTKSALAWTWFGHEIKPSPEAWLLARELAEYAATLAANTNRKVFISSALGSYDHAAAVEKPVISLSVGDPDEQIFMGRMKLILFLFALEDKCGQQNVTHAISDMVYALRGGEYGYPEFRSALEQQCHQNLDSLFHTWLAQPGIPPDFRTRYQSTGGGKQ